MGQIVPPLYIRAEISWPGCGPGIDVHGFDQAELVSLVDFERKPAVTGAPSQTGRPLLTEAPSAAPTITGVPSTSAAAGESPLSSDAPVSGEPTTAASQTTASPTGSLSTIDLTPIVLAILGVGVLIAIAVFAGLAVRSRRA
jgi:hypothetical protein